jgi:uncharacterized membrane protein
MITRSWKTTVAGLAAVLPQILHALYPTVVTIDVATGLSAFFAAIGLVAAKDGNVTGGNTPQ